MSAPPNKKRRYSYQLVTFKVEDEIYRVPRHGFTEFSEVFRAMFALPQPEGTRPEEGQCDENPIVLLGCTKLEFENLLEVLYPMAPRLQPEPLGKGQWIDVLKLSSMWSMDQVREVAIEELSKLATDPMTRAILAKRYRLPHWLAQAYKGVVEGFLANVWTCEQLHGCLGWETAALELTHFSLGNGFLCSDFLLSCYQYSFVDTASSILPAFMEASTSRTKSVYSYELVSFKVHLRLMSVEDEVYRVPRHGFEEYSEIFQSMLTLPQPAGSDEGLSDDNPIELPSCTKLEFESVLEVLYPLAARLESELVPLSKEQWVGALKLATQWSMDKVRKQAILELCDLLQDDPVEMIRLAKLYRIPEWMADGYVTIVEGWFQDRWTLDDLANNLGWETAARILELVVKARSSQTKNQGKVELKLPACPTCAFPTSITLHLKNPIHKKRSVKCPSCRNVAVDINLLEQVEGAQGHLHGDALRAAVEEAFKAEITSMS
ncbi:hypothetical protein NMY22_g4151 [Coprinellus aureogranulatus]|nr:hypothetical protein NMY22_g4151 [Coprinellus aureogranulatus]